VAQHVRCRLLHDAEHPDRLTLVEQRGVLEGDPHMHRAAGQQPVEHVPECRFEPEVVEQRRAQFRCQAPRGGDAAVQRLVHQSLLIGTQRSGRQPVQDHPQTGEHLSDLVMYLARHPAALVLDALFESARILRGSITCLRQFEGTGSDPFLECAIRLAQLAGQCRAGASFAQQQPGTCGHQQCGPRGGRPGQDARAPAQHP
jgi:hypothetical protein